MTALRVVIADDEPLARGGLARLLSSQGDVTVLGESTTGLEAVQMIRATRPNLVFLDVQMPELDGFDVLRALAPEPLPRVVFITAFDDYAVRAFDVHAIDYLVKPFSDERFTEMLARARKHLALTEAAAAVDQLAALLADKRDDALVVTTGRRSVVIQIDEIDWIEAQDYCVLVHAGATSHLLRESIRTLAQRLAARQFVRVHRSALVNLARVRELRRPANREWVLVLRDGRELPVSRRLRPTLTRYFARGA
jgi:two-component system LytT family response regulator